MIAQNKDVAKLMFAMTEFEGWEPASDDGKKFGSLTYQLHNPGALRYSPFQTDTRAGFAVFDNDQMGKFAFYWDLLQKAKGNSGLGLYPSSTIAELIEVWAPREAGNNTKQYVQYVLTQTGFNDTTTLGEIFHLDGKRP